MRIIGIDPGYERVGIAVLEKNAGERREHILYSACFKTDKKATLPDRLLLIGKEVERIIGEFSPTRLGIEKLYFENNQKTAMGVSEARGAIIYVAKSHNVEICEFTPLQIKSAVTGYGRAEKRDVHFMVTKLVDLPITTKQDDEIDAIAVALTAFATSRLS